MRYKKRDPIVHEPTTQEIFHCLSGAVEWCRILSQTSEDKSYHTFLLWLIDREFFESDPNRITVVKLAKEFDKPSSKIKLWVSQMYDDIFQLNEGSPQLFQKAGIKVSFYFKYYDSFAGLDTTVHSVPREYEKVSFPFVKAKVGTESFYVYMIRHVFTSVPVIEVWVQGGIMNKYRDLILEKAEFQQRIGWLDVHHMSPFEIDDRLRKIYPH